jgi:hypothetical protein
MDVKHEEGYRIRMNPDGSGAFVEGFKEPDPLDFVYDGTGAAIDRCARRMGLICSPRTNEGKILRNRINKLGRIVKLEHALCGEEDW